mmetsp:Transcript_27247/g.63277  ORF Transcript_27247/g.63277 Transcript_27247/m.63277 type:complete len:282 (-) Transcript_27247:176-1021(-)
MARMVRLLHDDDVSLGEEMIEKNNDDYKKKMRRIAEFSTPPYHKAVLSDILSPPHVFRSKECNDHQSFPRIMRTSSPPSTLLLPLLDSEDVDALALANVDGQTLDTPPGSPREVDCHPGTLYPLYQEHNVVPLEPRKGLSLSDYLDSHDLEMMPSGVLTDTTEDHRSYGGEEECKECDDDDYKSRQGTSLASPLAHQSVRSADPTPKVQNLTPWTPPPLVRRFRKQDEISWLHSPRRETGNNDDEDEGALAWILDMFSCSCSASINTTDPSTDAALLQGGR